MVEKYDWSRIANYVTGVCSSEEKRAFEIELLSDQGLRDVVDEAQRIWEGSKLDGELALTEWDLAATWQEFVDRKPAPSSPGILVLAPQRRHGLASPLPVRRRPVRAWMAAAAVTIAAGAALWFRADMNPWPGTSTSASASMYEVSTRPGQRLDLRMPDGSRVILGVASTLRYPKTYGVTRRDVYLEGRAYFEVTHEATKPFAVHTANAIARDLGTRFDVRAYKDDPRVDVVVTEGEVELASGEKGVRDAEKHVVLTAGQLGQVNADGAVSSRVVTDLDRYIAWTEGRLVFVDAELRDVLPEVARWYDVRFELTDSSLGSRRFTGTFYDEPLAEVVQFLALSVGASYKRDRDAVILMPNR